jgi:hypothetical protein
LLLRAGIGGGEHEAESSSNVKRMSYAPAE